VSVGTRAFTYDANGNMISDGLKTLTWDPGNRLPAALISAHAALLIEGAAPLRKGPVCSARQGRAPNDVAQKKTLR
jgi:hypothetical protein